MKTEKMFFSENICTLRAIALFVLLFLVIPGKSQTTETPVTLDMAKQYYQNYITTAKTFQDTLKGFLVSMNQLATLDSLIKNNRNLAGFRIYMAKDNAKNDVMLVVGVDNKGKDVTSTGKYSGIYMTGPVNSGPCPKMCDATSPITGD
jgi:hypothetical protein